MGTNFYYKIPLKKRKIEELQKLITEDPYSLEEVIEQYENLKKTHIIHLGKRSFGWQFLWNTQNNDYYANNLKSITEFLNSEGGYIENEYGEKFTTEEFLKDEIGDCLYKDDNHCDAWSYHAKHPKEPIYYDINNTEFISKDGLRFSKQTNFS